MITKHPDRFLFGSDEVGPKTEHDDSRLRDVPAAVEATEARGPRVVTRGNYVRLFDEARRRVRAWEADQQAHPQSASGSRSQSTPNTALASRGITVSSGITVAISGSIGKITAMATFFMRIGANTVSRVVSTI